MIWFKNAQVYRLSDSLQVDWNDWDSKFNGHQFSPCGQQQPVSLGFVPAIPDAEQLVHRAGEHGLVCVQRQERLLPASVVREVLLEKIDQIRLNEDRRVGSKERQTLKDEVVFSLLPKAFVRTTRNYIYFNTALKLMVVDSSSESRADELTSFMREAVGSLPATLLQSHCQPAAQLTSWLAQPEQQPEGWELLPDVEFTQSQNTDIKIRLKNVELDEDIIQSHIEQGARVQQIAINWQERISAVITAKAQIKRIRFSDSLGEQALEQSGDDKFSQFDASFHIMSAELSQLLQQMILHFGIAQDAS